MAGLPEITLAGTLVADPELRFMPTGAAVATFTVAANDRRHDPATGQWVDKGATFLRCCLWRQRPKTSPNRSPRAPGCYSPESSVNANGTAPRARSATPSKSTSPKSVRP